MIKDKDLKGLVHGPVDRKIVDGRGLFLLVKAAPGTGKLWRFRYKVGRRDTMISLGSFPDVTLEMARARLQEARTRLAQGDDPAQAKREQRELARGETFREVATVWMNEHFGKWESDRTGKRVRTASSLLYLAKIKGRMNNHIFPEIGSLPMNQIEAKDVLKALKKMEDKGLSDQTAKAKNEISAIFNYATVNDLGGAKYNPVPALKGSLKKFNKRHYPGLTNPAAVGQLLRDIDGYVSGQPTTRLCMKLMAYLWQRPTELRIAEWSEFNLESARWTIPSQRMKIKGRPDHVVPLPRQAVALLKELQTFTGHQRLLFPGIGGRDRPISQNTICKALRTMGYDTKTQHCGHGFRTTASTLIEEELVGKGDADMIFAKEAHLAHGKGGSRGPYARGQMIKMRDELLQVYADYLDGLRDSQTRPASTASKNSSTSDSCQRIA